VTSALGPVDSLLADENVVIRTLRAARLGDWSVSKSVSLEGVAGGTQPPYEYYLTIFILRQYIETCIRDKYWLKNSDSGQK
jgi:hypothetical protein